SQNTSAGINGSFAYMSGQWFATRTINDGFAVVSTDGTAGIPVMGENRLVGKTNAAGFLLVPNLLSYQNNHISIDTSALKSNESTEVDSKYAVPTFRSGVMLGFKIKHFSGGLLELVDDSGKHLPVGTTVMVGDGGSVATVGFDGQLFLEHIEAGAVLKATVAGGSCSTTLPDTKISRGVGNIGKFICAHG
ncbi:MAG: fimbria/pilus outer membrane usher protein, partial [Pseudomonadales bacterium]